MGAIRFGDLKLGGGGPLFFIGGPCMLEGLKHAVRHAKAIREVCMQLGVPFFFKASYDKANRTSGRSNRGPGLKQGLEILAKVKAQAKVPVLTDVHETVEVIPVAKVADIIQIPAFLCRQTDLVRLAGATGRIVNIKKGQFLDPWAMKHVADKARTKRVVLTERGVSFGYNNLVVDMRSIPVMRETGFPVVMDAGHAVQQPAGRGDASGGDRGMIPVIARSAVAAGADGLFIEVHEKPETARSDGQNMLRPDELFEVLRDCVALRRALVEAGHGRQERRGEA